MIRMELVRDPNGKEDDFVVVDNEGEITAYRETEFEIDIEGNKKIITPRGKE